MPVSQKCLSSAWSRISHLISLISYQIQVQPENIIFKWFWCSCTSPDQRLALDQHSAHLRSDLHLPVTIVLQLPYSTLVMIRRWRCWWRCSLNIIPIFIMISILCIWGNLRSDLFPHQRSPDQLRFSTLCHNLRLKLLLVDQQLTSFKIIIVYISDLISFPR